MCTHLTVLQRQRVPSSFDPLPDPSTPDNVATTVGSALASVLCPIGVPEPSKEVKQREWSVFWDCLNVAGEWDSLPVDDLRKAATSALNAAFKEGRWGTDDTGGVPQAVAGAGRGGGAGSQGTTEAETTTVDTTIKPGDWLEALVDGAASPPGNKCVKVPWITLFPPVM